MFLADLLFRLPPSVPVRIRFRGSGDTYCFTTGPRTTGRKTAEIIATEHTELKVDNIYPLWHANELYIECH
jgi:hypothetical protein